MQAGADRRQEAVAHHAARYEHLLATLRAYLGNDAWPSRACRALFIHRNTLGYRLCKVDSFLGARLDTHDGHGTSLSPRIRD